MDLERMLEGALSEEATPAQRIAAFEAMVAYVGEPQNAAQRWEVLDAILEPTMEVVETCPQRDVVLRANRLLETIEAMEAARQEEEAALRA